MDERLDELKKDFNEVLKCIDFKRYDPHSQIFLRALRIGQMYTTLKAAGEIDGIKEELDGARNYMVAYAGTNDADYKEMAKDELRHAGILIKKHLEKSDLEEKSKIDAYEDERQELLARIAKWAER